jgi:uncharacterized membrane protein YdjX (TVP38/TMEM64 family)
MRKGSALPIVALVAAAVVLSVGWAFVPLPDYFQRFRAWAEGAGAVRGLVVIALLYTPAVLVFFPSLLITMAAGFLYGQSLPGFLGAVVAISAGSNLAACIGFFVGRRLARPWVEQRIAERPRFRALQRAVADRGFEIILLTRLSPAFPFTLLCYAYGMMQVRFRDYLLASWLGMLPGTVLYIYLGSAAQNLTELLSGRGGDNPWKTAFFYVGLAATAAVVVLVTRTAQGALRQALAEHREPAAPASDEAPA